MSTFSIIIPCYNVAAFMHECLDCVQTKSSMDLVAISVDNDSIGESVCMRLWCWARSIVVRGLDKY